MTEERLDIREADRTWEEVRNKVVGKLFGYDVAPVPYLEDASHYGLLTVIIKNTQNVHHRPWRAKSLFPVGVLQDLVQKPAEKQQQQQFPQENFIQTTSERATRITPVFQCEKTKFLGSGSERRIYVHIGDVQKKIALFLLTPGQVTLRSDLPWIGMTKSLYIIYEVFYSSCFQMTITEGHHCRELKVSQPLPIAFSYLKFAVSSKGVVGAQKDKKKAKFPAGASWVKTDSLYYSMLTTNPLDRPDLVLKEQPMKLRHSLSKGKLSGNIA
uniref:Uncharacterized protein n=1 Tax=Latimeria chalumnae TaxID=7897 RepID=M3XLC0_LATCH